MLRLRNSKMMLNSDHHHSNSKTFRNLYFPKYSDWYNTAHKQQETKHVGISNAEQNENLFDPSIHTGVYIERYLHLCLVRLTARASRDTKTMHNSLRLRNNCALSEEVQQENEKSIF